VNWVKGRGLRMGENGLIGRINGQNLFKIAIFFGLLF
jgi:hypothetical protein